MTPEPSQTHDSPPNVRQDSQDKSSDSKEASPRSKEVSPRSKEASPRSKEASPQTKRWSGDITQQLALQKRDSLDSQSDQKQSDSGRENEIPSITSEPILLDHSKTSSTDSKHSEEMETGHTHEPPPISDNEPRSIISPTLKLASVLKDPGDGDASGDALFEMLEKSSDGLPENMSENQSTDTSQHDTSSNLQDDSIESNPASDGHHEHMLSPIVEGTSVNGSSGRQSPAFQDDYNATITEPPVSEGGDAEPPVNVGGDTTITEPPVSEGGDATITEPPVSVGGDAEPPVSEGGDAIITEPPVSVGGDAEPPVSEGGDATITEPPVGDATITEPPVSEGGDATITEPPVNVGGDATITEPPVGDATITEPPVSEGGDATVTEPPVSEGEEEKDGLEILVQLDKVLDKEDLYSDAEEDEESKFKDGGPTDVKEVGNGGGKSGSVNSGQDEELALDR